MKDRISLYPGRVMLTPVAGQENVYDMVRADEPQEVGTPLNKANLLTDDTATMLGLDPETATPNDAFNVIAATNIKDLVIKKIVTSQTWVAPKAKNQLFKVFCVGGGGGGGTGAYSGNGAGGGGGGYIEISEITIPEGTVVAVTCGAGGASGSGPAALDTGKAGGATTFGSYLTAAGGKGGGAPTTSKGGAGGAGGAGGGGGSGMTSSSATGGAGGAGDTYGGGGGGGSSRSSTRPAGGAGGTYGGAGGKGAKYNTSGQYVAAADGQPFAGPFMDALLQIALVVNANGVAGGQGDLTTYGSQAGAGGFGGNGGNSGLFTGGGGGGYGGNGGNGSSGAGGGGGGYFGNGGGGGSQASDADYLEGAGGGGGGGFFCNGGTANSSSGGYAGGGGGFFSDGEKYGKGGNGGVLIMYFKED